MEPPEDRELVEALLASDDNSIRVDAAYRPRLGRLSANLADAAATGVVTRRVDRVAEQATLHDRQIVGPFDVEPSAILDGCNAGRSGSPCVDASGHRQFGSSTTWKSVHRARLADGAAAQEHRRQGSRCCRQTDAPGPPHPRHGPSTDMPRADSRFVSGTARPHARFRARSWGIAVAIATRIPQDPSKPMPSRPKMNAYTSVSSSIR